MSKRFEGFEWLNISVSALILAIIPLAQAFFNLHPGTSFKPDWTVYFTYFIAFFLVGIAYYAKRAVMSLMSIVASVSMMMTGFIWLSFVNTGGLGFSTYSTQVYVACATISAGAFIGMVFDGLIGLTTKGGTKLNLDNDYILSGPFVLITIWSAIKIYLGYTTLSTVQLVLQALVFVWSLMGIIAVILSGQHKLDKIDIAGVSFDNMTFFVAAIAVMLFIASWAMFGTGLMLA